MAFSTQKDFFNVPFLDETVEFECVDHCLKIKTYGSTFDDRSWAAGDTQQSKFLYDLVNCLTPGVSIKLLLCHTAAPLISIPLL